MIPTEILALDRNGNGISDLYERIHSPTGALDPNADLDGDGYTALAEYLLGGDPNYPDLHQLVEGFMTVGDPFFRIR